MSLLDRRRLLTSGAAAALFAATGVDAAIAPKRGGVLRLGLSGGRPEDRFYGQGGYGIFMMVAAIGCAYETLTTIGPDGSLRGELAQGWEPLEGGRVWVLTLRSGVTFHDGRALAADDAAASLRRHLRQGDGRVAPPALSAIRKVSAQGERLLRIELARPDPDLPLALADPNLIVHPAARWKEALTRGLGTGAYRMDRFEPGVGFTASRVAAHWSGDTQAWFDRIEAQCMNDPATRVRALLGGRVDVIDAPADPGFGRLEMAGVTVCAPTPGLLCSERLAHPSRIGHRLPMDDARLTQRWWFA